jgi:hypothetical protein
LPVSSSSIFSDSISLNGAAIIAATDRKTVKLATARRIVSATSTMRSAQAPGRAAASAARGGPASETAPAMTPIRISRVTTAGAAM